MQRKILFGLLFFIFILAFSVSYTFAANGLENAANGVKNVVGNAENSIENTARGVANTSKDATEAMENAGNNMTENKNDVTGTTMNNNSGNYTAMRTSTSNNGTLLGMNSTVWIWLILALLAVAIISLIYSYSAGISTQKHYDNNGDE